METDFFFIFRMYLCQLNINNIIKIVMNNRFSLYTASKAQLIRRMYKMIFVQWNEINSMYNAVHMVSEMMKFNSRYEYS